MVNPAANRRGRGTLGCLAPLVLLALLLYLGVKFGRPWFADEQFQDEVRSTAKFASTLSDSAMRARIVAQADSLHLPPAAKTNLRINRLTNPSRVLVETHYDVEVILPFIDPVKLKFKVHAEDGL
jgi:hypothetical protein